MNKILTFCRAHNYHILNSKLDDNGELIIYTKQGLTPEIINIISTERLLGGWQWDGYQAYIWVFKGKWLWFLHVGDTITKLQAKTLPDLQNKILTHASTLPHK